MTITADIGSSVCLQPALQDSYYFHLYDLLEGEKPSTEVCELLSEIISKEDFNNPLAHVEGYRKLFALLITCEIRKELSGELDEVRSTLFKRLNEIQTWQEYQLVTAYNKLCSGLSGDSETKSLDIHIEEDGFAPIEHGQHWKWAGISLQPYHIELGLTWALLGIHSNQHNLISSAYQLALFQLNLLDNEYLPLQGLFSQEKDAVFSEQVGWLASLFHCVGHSFQKHELLSISNTQAEFLNLANKKVHPLLPLIFRWKPFGKTLSQPTKPPLSAAIKSSSLGMCGKRTENTICISTLYGGRTGMGTYHVNRKLSVVTFGPQYQPYGDCQGFGVESNSFDQNKFPSLSIEENGDGYLLKGYTKVVGKNVHETPYAISGNSEHSEIWLDAKQELSDGVYDLQVNYLSYLVAPPLSFVFYIKAEECEIQGVQTLKPKSLDRYQGIVERLTFSSNGRSISIEPNFTDSVMEVIPLAGDDSFWGCDFLVGFTVNEHVLKHRWKITHIYHNF